MAAKTTDNLQEICPLCSESITIYAIGSCDHPVCYKCSTRMRVLCEQLYCAICRTDMQKVIFCKKRHKFHSIGTHGYPCFRRTNTFFETEELQSEFYHLQDNSCHICKDLKPLRTFVMLKNHMRKEHNLFYCDLCVKHLKVFSSERKTYDRKRLGEHRRIGDVDDHSQNHKGHPLCKFCDERYLDNDELVRHLRIDHYYCHFCDSDGISNLFFGMYDDLREHFRDSHYLCEEGDCLYEKFTSAFRTDIDFKAHTSQTHGRGMAKSAARQARVIDVDFQFSDSNRRGHAGSRDGPREGPRDGPRDQRQGYNRGRGRRDRQREREEEESAKALSAVLTDIQRHGHVNVVDKALLQSTGTLGPVPDTSKAAVLAFEEQTADFPSMDGRVSHVDRSSDEEDKSGEESRHARDTLAKRLARANKFSVQDGDMEDQDFPSLGGGGAPVQPLHPRPTKAWEFRAAASDFPTLGSGAGKKAASQRPAQSGTWVVTKPQPQPFNTSAVSNVSRNSLSDFPSLSSIGGSLFKPPMARVQSSVQKPKPRPAQPQTVSQPRATQPQRHTAPPSQNRDWTDNRDEDEKTTVVFQNSVQEHQSKIKTIKVIPDNSRPVAQNSQKNLRATDFPSLKSEGADFPSLGKSSKKPSQSSDTATSWGPKKTEAPKEPVPEEISEAGQFLKMKTKNKKKKSKGAKSLQDNDWDSASPHWSDADSGDLSARPPSSATPASLKDLGQKLENKAEQPSKKPEPTESAKDKKSKQKKGKGSKEKKEADKEVKKVDKLAAAATDKSPPATKKLKSHTTSSDDSARKEEPKGSKAKAKEPEVSVQTKSGEHVDKEQKKKVEEPQQHIAVSKDVIDFFPSFSEEYPSLVALKDKSNVLTPAAPGWDSEDFPALGVAPVKSTPPPPPGFQGGASKPPPGFGAPAAKRPPPPPPGLTSSATTQPASNAENVAPASNGIQESYTYIQPSNFQQRNCQLISDIQGLLGNSDDKFLKFKMSSGEFRQGKIPATEYHSKCSEVIGVAGFQKIFAELLVLLPDIEKQQQLLAAQTQEEKSQDGVLKIGKKAKKAAWNSASGATKFTTCATCQQVVATSDLSVHRGQHSSSSDFPTLGSSTAPGIVGMGSWGSRK